MSAVRRFPIGAEIIEGRADFRVWGPKCRKVEVVFGNEEIPPLILSPEGDGYFSGATSALPPCLVYWLRLDGEHLVSDPASRFQPKGPHGPSMLVDPASFTWTDKTWPGAKLEGQVMYELHIGTFTAEGTWAAAATMLPELAALGITSIELMPIADFPGEFNWGYDGVNMFAPSRLYGTPDNLREFVDRAHRLGIGVILDVVYNHFGPDGNFIDRFSDSYFTDRYENEWGKAINFDGPDAAPVREFFISNAAYWISEFHLDGLRLDATQQIFDSSDNHILTEIGQAARHAGAGREILIVAETETQVGTLVRPAAEGGNELDGMWNDDFHHSVKVATTGKSEAYYSDYRGTAQEILSAVKYGFLYQGQYYSWQKKRRGTPALDIPSSRFVNCLENHDQVANSGAGLRLHQLTSPGRFRAATALLLLIPATPMLFQGQEFASTRPFLFFADHRSDLAPHVRKGRAQFLSQFPSLALEDAQSQLADPGSSRTFQACKLDHSEKTNNSKILKLYSELIKRRKEYLIADGDRWGVIDGAVLSSHAFAIRFFGRPERLLIINFGSDLSLTPLPEPLLAPPAGTSWKIVFSTEDPQYGGPGAAAHFYDHRWLAAGESAELYEA